MKMTKNIVIALVGVLLSFVNLQVLANSKVGTAIDDSVITTKINAKMLADKRVSALKVGVTTTDGIVWLSGVVPTEEEAAAAVELATSTPGVVDVDTTNLMVQASNNPLTDAYITAKIRGLYIREKLMGDKNIPLTGIHIETKDGITYLTGEVDSNEQKKNAEKLAKSVKGVEKVDSRLIVK